jgi:hypothetical protein
MNFTLGNGRTLHLVVLGGNRIGTVHSLGSARGCVLFHGNSYHIGSSFLKVIDTIKLTRYFHYNPMEKWNTLCHVVQSITFA